MTARYNAEGGPLVTAGVLEVVGLMEFPITHLNVI